MSTTYRRNEDFCLSIVCVRSCQKDPFTIMMTKEFGGLICDGLSGERIFRPKIGGVPKINMPVHPFLPPPPPPVWVIIQPTAYTPLIVQLRERGRERLVLCLATVCTTSKTYVAELIPLCAVIHNCFIPRNIYTHIKFICYLHIKYRPL